MFLFLTKLDDHCNRNWIKAYLTYKILFENSGLFQMESKVIDFLNVDYCLPILITRRQISEKPVLKALIEMGAAFSQNQKLLPQPILQTGP